MIHCNDMRTDMVTGCETNISTDSSTPPVSIINMLPILLSMNTKIITGYSAAKILGLGFLITGISVKIGTY